MFETVRQSVNQSFRTFLGPQPRLGNMNFSTPWVRKLPMADGVALHVEDWVLPIGVPRRGCALLVHGLGEHIGRYRHVIDSMLSVGIEVRGYDQRGFGRSPGPRAGLPHDHALLDDVRLAYDDWCAERGEPAFLIGHSMGGTVAARAATGGWIRPRGLVLSSPAIATLRSRLQKLALLIGRRLSPNGVVPSGLNADLVSRDPTVVAAYRSDPFNHGLITPRLAGFIVDAGPRIIAAAPEVRFPTLVLIGTDDRLVDIAGARRFHDRLPQALRTLHAYDGLYHEIFNELPMHRARVLGDLQAWLVRISEGGDPESATTSA